MQITLLISYLLKENKFRSLIFIESYQLNISTYIYIKFKIHKIALLWRILAKLNRIYYYKTCLEFKLVVGEMKCNRLIRKIYYIHQ